MEGSSKLGQEAGWARSHIKTADNPYIDADDLEDKRRRTDPATFRQEYEASFEAKKGVVYSDFSDTYTHKGGHCFNSSDVDHESYIRISDQWTHYRAIDPGLANPTAVVWAAVDPKGNVYVYDEYSLSGALVKEHAMNIAAKTHDPVLTSFIDPKAAARRTSLPRPTTPSLPPSSTPKPQRGTMKQGTRHKRTTRSTAYTPHPQSMIFHMAYRKLRCRIPASS
jgi:hypothetical protein